MAVVVTTAVSFPTPLLKCNGEGSLSELVGVCPNKFYFLTTKGQNKRSISGIIFCCFCCYTQQGIIAATAEYIQQQRLQRSLEHRCLHALQYTLCGVLYLHLVGKAEIKIDDLLVLYLQPFGDGSQYRILHTLFPINLYIGEVLCGYQVDNHLLRLQIQHHDHSNRWYCQQFHCQ